MSRELPHVPPPPARVVGSSAPARPKPVKRAGLQRAVDAGVRAAIMAVAFAMLALGLVVTLGLVGLGIPLGAWW